MAGKGSVNKAILIGNVGQDPEIRYTPSNMAVASFSVATSDVRKNKQTGESIEETEWHRCTAFGKLAEIIERYVKKGSKLYIEGRIKTEKWEKDGQTRYTTKIIVDQMTMLGEKGGQSSQQQGGGQRRDAAQQSSNNQPSQDFSDDIPF